MLELSVRNSRISAGGGTNLAVGLKENPSIEVLRLGHNDLRSEGALALASALKLRSGLRVLSLKSNGIGNHGAAGLAEVRTNARRCV